VQSPAPTAVEVTPYTLGGRERERETALVKRYQMAWMRVAKLEQEKELQIAHVLQQQQQQRQFTVMSVCHIRVSNHRMLDTLPLFILFTGS